MCLYFNQKATIEVKKRLEEKGKISVWKFVERHLHRLPYALISRYYVDFQWHPGENVSNRGQIGSSIQSIRLTKNEKKIGRVNEGFHFFLKRPKQAYWFLPGPDKEVILIRCIGKLEDFVAAGYGNQAVFAKVTLPKSEYNKALVPKPKKLKKKSDTIKKTK
jgi:hypothetical protein